MWSFMKSHFCWDKFILSVKTNFVFYLDKVACIKFLWQCNWVFLTLWSALSCIMSFTFFLNFTPTVNCLSVWGLLHFQFWWPRHLLLGKVECCIMAKEAAAQLTVCYPEANWAIDVQGPFTGRLKMDMLALIIMCIGYKSTDLRPKAVRFVLYANGNWNVYRPELSNRNCQPLH